MKVKIFEINHHFQVTRIPAESYSNSELQNVRMLIAAGGREGGSFGTAPSSNQVLPNHKGARLKTTA